MGSLVPLLIHFKRHLKNISNKSNWEYLRLFCGIWNVDCSFKIWQSAITKIDLSSVCLSAYLSTYLFIIYHLSVLVFCCCYNKLSTSWVILNNANLLLSCSVGQKSSTGVPGWQSGVTGCTPFWGLGGGHPFPVLLGCWQNSICGLWLPSAKSPTSEDESSLFHTSHLSSFFSLISLTQSSASSFIFTDSRG